MSEQLSDVDAEARTRVIDGAVLRKLLVGVAGAAVIGGGALGFLWLSSVPGADAEASALTGVPSVPSADATPPRPAGPIGFSVGGRDIFAATVAPSVNSDLPVEGVSGSSAVIPTSSTPSVVVTAVPTAVIPRAASSAGNVAGGGTISTSAPSVSAVTSPVAAVPVPGPSRSTAPAWEAPAVGFVTGNADYGVFDLDGKRVTVLTGQLIYPLSVRYQGVVVVETPTPTPTPTPTSTAKDSSVLGKFTSENNPATGWLVPSNLEKPTQLPAAALGKVSGQVRLNGVLRDQYWVRVDRQDDVLMTAGTAVGTTGLTLTGASDKRVPYAGAIFTDGVGNVYFGSMGERESDGVLY